MLKEVVAMSRNRASNLEAKDLSDRPTAIISIGGKYTNFTQLSSSFARTLRTNFEFVDGNFRKPNDGGPTPEQIAEIIDFIRSLVEDTVEYNLVVHCGEGRFRSVAVATYIDMTYRNVKVTAAEPGIKINGGSQSLFRDLMIAEDERQA